MWLVSLIHLLTVIVTFITSEDIPIAVNTVEGSNFRKLTMSTTINSFIGLLSSGNTLVDKTLLIKYLVDGGDRINLIAAPHKFGKSINLSMLKTFFEIVVDTKGDPVPPKTTNNHNFFVNGRIVINYLLLTLNDRLLISQHQDIIDQYQGKYPVIYLDLSTVTAKSYPVFLQQFQSCIAEMFKKHEYLLDILERQMKADHKNRKTRKKFQVFSRILEASRNTTVKEIITSGHFLSQLLRQHFNKSSILLIDEYDLPFNMMLMSDPSPFSMKDNQKLQLLVDFLEYSLVNNGTLKMAVLTGSLKLANEILLPNIRVDKISNTHAFSDHKLSPFYGFGEREVEKLLNLSRILPSLRKNFYMVYKSYVVLGRQIYNPYTISEFVENQKSNNYWKASKYVDTFVKKNLWYISFQNLLLNFAYGVSIKLDLKNWLISEQDLQYFITTLSNRKSNLTMTTEENDSAMRLLCSGGYLNEISSNNGVSVIACPNNEIKMALKKKMYTYFQKIPRDQLTQENSARVETIKNRLQKDLRVFKHNDDTSFLRNFSYLRFLKDV